MNENYLLSNYFEILKENRIAKYLQCKYTPAFFDKSDSVEKLWLKHDQILKNIKLSDSIPKQSFLDLKIEIADRIYQSCCFCERRCKVNREKEIGNCKVEHSRVASEFLHIGEEKVLIPSHTIFFSGCTFHCVFCQNWDISQKNIGTKIKPSNLVDIICKAKLTGPLILLISESAYCTRLRTVIGTSGAERSCSLPFWSV